jgi:hypothetical protein
MEYSADLGRRAVPEPDKTGTVYCRVQSRGDRLESVWYCHHHRPRHDAVCRHSTRAAARACPGK